MTRIFESKNGISLIIYCPACKCGHTINREWQYDGNKDFPTVSPSILLWSEDRKGKQYRCHSFVRAGRIEFLTDCTHEMAGKTVDLPEIESMKHYSFGE